MTFKPRLGSAHLSILLAAAVFGFWSDKAEAQYGMGFGGFGYGFGFTPVPQPGTFINSLALTAAGRPSTAPGGRPYAGDPNAYINHVRDNGFVEHFSVDRSQAPSYAYANRPSVARSSSVARNPAVPPAMTVPQPKPVLPLASFYNGENVLAWPSDAPLEGDLHKKRATFDDASRLALAETRKSGVASLASVSDARRKLIEYGQPALQYVRAHETPRLADTFHLFLLSLYESLAQAASNPVAPAVPAS